MRSCIHVFPLFSRARCAKILARIERLLTVGRLKSEAPNSMNKYGTVFDDPAWCRYIDRLVAKHVAPRALRCYGIRLAKHAHYGFLVRYDVGRQRGLAAHFDSSDVTLNVCLGARFKGGDLIVEPGTRIPHAVGRAIVHHGRTVHRAEPITAGRRLNLIVWCRRAASRPYPRF